MDNVDINLFKFDYDLTMAQFFMNGRGLIYARYGVRKDGKGDLMQSLPGIKDAMRKALEVHKKDFARPAPSWKPFDTQDLTAFKRDPRRPGGCLHCHHAGFYLRQEEYSVGRLSKETIWGYPLPDNIGLTLDIDKNTIVTAVTNPAEKAGIQPGDRIVSIDGQRILTPADITWALHVFKGGTLKVVVDRAGKSETCTMTLKGADWRKTNIVWRMSWWDSGPNVGLQGQELTSEERKPFGLSDESMAIKVTQVDARFCGAASGVKTDDIIVGMEGKSPDMEAIEFLMHIRLKYKAGEKLPLVLLRGGRKVPLTIDLK
jgi:C-terminal processing protease CtpA/Prc